MSPGDFHALNAFILKTTGMNIPESNLSTVEAFVSSRLAFYGLTMTGYLQKLNEYHEERDLFLSGITINETYFFREEKQFFLIRDSLIPRWNSEGNDILNVWSASCSTGEEPLSLLALLEQHSRRPFRILASDISPAAMEGFTGGEYRKSAFRSDGRELAELMNPLIEKTAEKTITLSKKALDKIDRKIINVFRDKLDDIPPMDLIFFRNTMIYMSPANREAIVTRLSECLKPEGILFLSVSETPLINSPFVKLEEERDVFFFRKPGTVPKPAASISPRTVEKIKYPRTVISARTDFDDLSVCRIISRISTEQKDLAGSVNYTALLYKKLIEMLNDQLLEEAEKLLKEQIDMKKSPGLFAFFSGYLAYSSNRFSEAYSFFAASIEKTPQLWPARFYLLRSAGDLLSLEVRKEQLERILIDIREYIRAGRYDFQIMLEGFNARYFEMICRRELEDIGARRGKYAYQ